MSDPNAPQPVRPRYTGGQIAMLVIGTILLLPGVCSLLFMIGMASELARGDPIVAGVRGRVGHLLLHLGRRHRADLCGAQGCAREPRARRARKEIRRHERARIRSEPPSGDGRGGCLVAAAG